jgi:hypothetical protein
VSNMSWFDKLKIKPHTKARFGIPLWRMGSMPIVHLALLVDIWKMELVFNLGTRNVIKFFMSPKQIIWERIWMWPQRLSRVGMHTWGKGTYTTRNLLICNQSLCNWHVTNCRLQLSWSYLQLQIWYCIIFGPYGCVCN